ncbi:centrosomal protein of 152 kDa isoform X2 [Oryzias melastigma]|uniref:centrosomal protein of 152 kDa isoform X2 n=1 Tax=Oryzias melastigma TaxID=30732 RepID=UPI000CF830DA|nr:centrosomal protein of 152 kDa isoform X2 [Oryzias melastigma]
MGPSIVEAVEDLRNIQQSLWELHQLLTDLPDDMLEDSRDCSSPELEGSTYSNKNTGNSPQSQWNQQWSDHTHAQNFEDDYDGGPHADYAYKGGGAHINQHQSQNPPLPHTWNQEHQFGPEDYEYTNRCTENEDFPIHYEPQSYPERTENHMEYNGGEDYMDEQNSRNPFQNLKSELEDQLVNQYKVSYNPQHPAHLPKMSAQQEGPYDHLQRQLLDKTQQTADQEQISQLQILNKAQQRQIEDMERKLEDSRRSLRYLEHQFAIIKDEKDGLAVSLKESSRLVEQAKDREAQMQKKLTSVEQQLQTLSDRDQENVKKLRMADAAVDSMKQQMLELCRTDTLSRVREQHDRDIAIMKEQHDAALLVLQQKLDSASQGLSEQIDAGQRLREQVKLLERQREEEQLERARVVNSLSQRLEDSQQQCGKLLQTNSVQEMKQMELKLQQAQSSKALSENMNKALQEDMADLKEQITLYESAVKHGVVALDLNSEWDHHLSESCLDLGFKQSKRKNGVLHSVVAQQPDSKLPKDEALRLLRAEMQRCLGCLKGKRQKISQLQEELQQRQAQVHQLQTELEEAKLNSAVKESQMRTLDTPGDSQKELMKLQEEKQLLQEQVELLEKQNKELKVSEEKVKCANTELCTKMREMIQELDQEKQEAAQRSERINQQYRDDVVNRVRTELEQEHDAQLKQLTALHQEQLQQLQKQLSEVSDKMLAVQECYISVCKEKSLLEEMISNTEKEKEIEIQQQVDSRVAVVEAEWRAKLQEIEKAWTQRLKASKGDQQREAAELACQTDETEANGVMVSAEELDSRLTAQKQQLQLEADKMQRQAVEDTRKQVQRELQKKHLQDMAKQVEGAVTRAYNRWIEDLPSLPEYKTCLQAEREKWEMLQENLIKQRVSQALKDAEEQGTRNLPEQHGSGARGVEDLEEELADLRSQLEEASTEQAALLKAELAAARAAWNRDKQQEISVLQACSEQACQSKLQEQSKRMEQALQQVREDAELQREELLLQMEARLQQTVRAREEEWRRQFSERKTIQQMRAEFLAELQCGLAEVHKRLFESTKADQEGTDGRRTSGSTSEAMIHIIEASVRDVVNRAVSEAGKEWKRTSEEKLSRALKEAQDQHNREIHRVQSSSSQRKEPPRCSTECSETLSKLQKKNQELQRHLEKACRQLQHSIRDHKRSTQQLKDEHERKLQQMSSDHLQQLEEVKRNTETSGSSDQQSLHQGLEEMKQQYLTTVEKIRGDMLRYLQESRERAAEMIRTEVQRERQNTARKMRHYYLTCLQELLEDGGKTTGAEKKIMNAASKLAAMAKVLETPIRNKSVKKHSSPAVSTAVSGSQPSRSTAFRKKPSAITERPETSVEERPHEKTTSADWRQKTTAPVKTQAVSYQDGPACEEGSESRLPPQSPPKAASQFHVDFVNLSVSGRNMELFLQGGEASKEAARRWKPFLVQEPPVREEKPTDWTTTSCGVNLPRLSDSGRRVEPVKPFSVSAVREAGELDSLTSDSSHLTVYNEMPRKPETFTHAKKSAHREPTPGSEREGDCSGPLFSELRQRQQDSGFDSPLYQQRGAKDRQV